MNKNNINLLIYKRTCNKYMLRSKWDSRSLCTISAIFGQSKNLTASFTFTITLYPVILSQ